MAADVAGSGYPTPPESLESQVSRLADFILHEVPGEPSANEGAVDTAIRIIHGLLRSNAEQRMILGHTAITAETVKRLKAELEQDAAIG